MNSSTLRIFISHTSEMSERPTRDQSFVSTTRNIIAGLNNYSFDEQDSTFFAESRSDLEMCRRRIAECDVFLALIGYRYGSLIADESISPQPSFVEWECNEAFGLAKPRLVFVWNTSQVSSEDVEHKYFDRQREFRKQLGTLAQGRFEAIDDFSRVIEESLRHFGKEATTRAESQAPATAAPTVDHKPLRIRRADLPPVPHRAFSPPDQQEHPNGVALLKSSLTHHTQRPIAIVSAEDASSDYPDYDEAILEISAYLEESGSISSSQLDELRSQSADLDHQALRLRDHVGEGLFKEAASRVFRTRRDSHGRSWTELQEAVTRLPFTGILTFGLHPGLSEARRMVLPEGASADFLTSKDADAIRRWRSGRIWAEMRLPVLYFHGVSFRPDTISLLRQEQEHLYRDSAFTGRLMTDLLSRERLVFLGFSGREAIQTYERLAPLAKGLDPVLRHQIFLPNPSDTRDAERIRRQFSADLQTRVTFTDEEVPGLGVLQELLEATDVAVDVTLFNVRGNELGSVYVRPAVRHDHGSLGWDFHHETTEDKYFTGRDVEKTLLSRHFADPAIRLVAVTGIGGTGKTALVTNWVRHNLTPSNSAFLFWSFYVDNDTNAFLEKVAQFLGVARQSLTRRRTFEDLPRLPTLIVLDGLEMLQAMDRTGDGFGSLLDENLRSFMHVVVTSDSSVRLVLTSRFPFPDVRPYIGRAAAAMELTRLTHTDGIALLRHLDCPGSENELAQTVENLQGHPLSLRVLASVVAAAPEIGAGSASTKLGQISRQIALDDTGTRLEAKLRRLCEFYLRSLDSDTVTVFKVLSFMYRPVDADDVAQMARAIDSSAKLSGRRAVRRVQSALDHLAERGLVAAERQSGVLMYSAHPALRDTVRAIVVEGESGLSQNAASVLADVPQSAVRVGSRSGIEQLCRTLMLFAETGDAAEAMAMFVRRLDNGEPFKHLPSYQLGLEVAEVLLAGLESQDPRRRDLNALGGLLALKSGHTAKAAGYLRTFRTAKLRDRAYSDGDFGAWYFAEYLTTTGQFEQALALCDSALSTFSAGDDWSLFWSLLREDAASSIGAVTSADRMYSIYEKLGGRYGNPRPDILRTHCWPVDAALRSARRDFMDFEPSALDSLIALADGELGYCATKGWTDGANRWSAALARLSFLRSADESWIYRLTDSIGILRASQQTHDLCGALVWRAAAWLTAGALDDASADVNEALSIAGPRAWAPLECDSYFIRTQIRRSLNSPNDEVAADRSRAAQISGESRYVSLFR